MSFECFNTIEEICAALEEDLDSEQCREIQEHLDTCPQCCAQVDSLRKTVTLFKCIGEVKVPKQIDMRLWKVLNLQKPCD